MKNSIKGITCKFGLILFLMMVTITGRAQNQTFTMSIASATVPTTVANSIDVDLIVTCNNPSSGMRFTGFSTSINFNTAIVNGGTITASYVAGSRDQSLTTAGLAAAAVNTATAGCVRLPIKTIPVANGIDMVQGGTLHVGTYRITNSVPWATANASLWLQDLLVTGKTQSLVQASAYGSTTPPTSFTTTVPTSPVGVVLGYTQAAPYSLQVGQICATSASQTSSTGVTCFGGNNGSSTITLSPTPTVSSITYTVDGGASQSATLVGGAFTISGLSSGVHTVVISNTGCSNVTATGVSVSTPSNLVASSSAGSISCFGGSTTVTVSATGGTAPYTGTGSFTASAGSYSYTVTDANGCSSTTTGTVSQPSQLTASSSAGTIACFGGSTTVTVSATGGTAPYTGTGSFTASAGSYSYTVTDANGCSSTTTGTVSQPSQLTNSTTASGCESYTWSVTGQTYTTSGTYTGTSTNGNGCAVNETLNLTINHNSTSEETQSACNSYTWHGTTYTASGDYTYTGSNASGCQNIVTLHLTINSDGITTQPTAPVICKLLGASATVSVVAANSSSATYQWYMQASTASTGWTSLINNTNYSGVTSSTLTITRTTTTVPAAGTKYRVEVSGSCGTTSSSNTVALQDQTVLSKVATPTVVTKLTPALTTCEGSSVVLSLAAGSIGNIQLQSSTDGISWNNSGSVVAQSAVSVANPAMTFNTGVLTQDTWFRLMASNGVCSSVVSTSVKITVSTTPDAGAISGGDVTVCTPVAAGLNLSGATVAITNSTTLTLTGSSLGATILWQKSINYLAATPVWAAAGSTSTSLTVNNLAASTWYRAKITNGACVVYTDVVKITVTPTAKAGVVSSATSVCSGGNIAFTSAAYVGSSLQWQVSTTSATLGFADVVGETGLVFNMTSVAYAPLSKFYVRTVVTSGDCTIARSAVKTILVNPTSVGGTVTGGGTVCNSGLAGTLKLAGNTGTIQWQYSTDGVNYTNAPSSTGTAPTFTTTSANSTAATYIVSNVTSDTYFRALVTSGACSSAVSNAVQYVVGTAAVAGTASAGSTEVCPTFGTTITLSGSTGSIAWKKSTNWTAATPTWSAVTTSVSPTLSTGALAASTAYKAVVTIGGCSTVESNVVVVIVTAKPVSKGITANVTSPAGAATTPLCTSSTSKVLTVTAGYLGNIQWQSSTTSATAGFADISGATATTYTISGASVGANYFRVKFTNSCGVEVFSSVLTIYYKDCTPPAKTAAPFGVAVYPNPSSESFNFNLSTSSEEKVSVVVYDMTGKLVDSREVAPSEVSELQVGDRYPSGVYNMIVTQGENTKTLRVIKR
jgi:hypothetical protein